MSILPLQTKGYDSSSSSQAPSPPLTSHYGHHPLRSLSISPPLSSFSTSGDSSGSLAQGAEDFCGSSETVTEAQTSNDLKYLPGENTKKNSRGYSGGRGTGPPHSRGKMLEMETSLQHGQISGHVSSQGSSSHSTGRKVQMMNCNHLLNFQYDPISRPQRRAPPPRRQQKIKPYNKDLFLQANYKFVILDSENYTAESMDPDKMLRWEDIICVRYSTTSLVQCPICLEYPLCPQITSCGHIFCFPCILRYLLMGEEDHKGDCWKRCPLCFVRISPNDLYTVYIEVVKQYSVGDLIEFVLLRRKKDSSCITYKNLQEPDGASQIYDPFSKFTFTSDVDLSVRKAISDLDGWLAKADSGLVDDLEKLPYVCAAMERLEQRKKHWNENRVCLSAKLDKNIDFHEGSHFLQLPGNGDSCYGDVSLPAHVNDESKLQSDEIAYNLDAATCLAQSPEIDESVDGEENALSSSYEEKEILLKCSTRQSDGKAEDLYNFYQARDGQHLILHPLDLKCLLHHFGSYDMLPQRISGRILQLETVTQSEATRKRYRYLSHFSLTTTFQLCEIDLRNILPPGALIPFMDIIRSREKQRKQLAKKERREKIKAEAGVANSVPQLPSFRRLSCDNSFPNFSLDDFEALGSSTPNVTSTSPPVGNERRLLFSSVTKLGFAAGHDSPALKIEEANSLHSSVESSREPSAAPGLRNGGSGTGSFANVLSRAKSGENLEPPKTNEAGKRGKKQGRVLLSTACGRRY